MLKISKIENDSIVYYTCSCGVTGKCIVRPLSRPDTLTNQLVYVECPECGNSISVALSHTELIRNGISVEEDIEYQCGIVIKNEILKG